MLTIHPQYITDTTGKKLSVVLPINEFKILLEELEELEEVKLFDAAKSSNEPSIPIEEAFQLLEAKRKSEDLSGNYKEKCH